MEGEKKRRREGEREGEREREENIGSERLTRSAIGSSL